MSFSPPFALSSSSSLVDDDDRRRFYMANNAFAPLSMSPGKSTIGTHGSNASEIQHHLYSAFLEGRTSDVALHVRGSWEGIYRLHRVVLIQAGFFRSLFDGGFREALRVQDVQNEVNVTFDDPNITRAAFEICISRLYGGGPNLFIDPTLIPTRTHPLTTAFPHLPPPAPVSEGHQPATPRLLLSLLATATYLAIPSLISQALNLVLKSIGPHTALQYLNFSIGKGISYEYDTGHEPAVGLESLCQVVDTGSSRTSRAPSVRTMSYVSTTEQNEASVDPDSTSEVEKLAEDLASMRPLHRDICRRNFSETHSIYAHSALSNLTRDADAEDEYAGPVFLYGAVSDKIGEAAVCWICRWGVDILPYEEATASSSDSLDTSPASPVPGPSNLGHKHTTSYDSRLSVVASAGDVPQLWRRGGLPARWICAILSSNSFFVKDEKQRYEVARSIVELRRREGVNAKEEQEWEQLFAKGIHYMHMSLDDLLDISHDVSPTTGTPYVPSSVIQGAHWEQSLLRQHITVHPVKHLLSPSSSISTSTSNSAPTASTFRPNSPPRSPGPPRDRDLGLAWTAGELRSSSHPLKDRLIYPVPTDASTRLGDTSGLAPNVDVSMSMEQLFNPRPQQTLLEKGKSPSGAPSPAPHPSHANFFGILSDSGRSVDALSQPLPNNVKKWTPFPPVRFGVEFWGVSSLKEKGRLHSQTIWYAGSLYNVYVQVVRKKDSKDKSLQLGVYLHRQSSVDPIPPPSAPLVPFHPHGSARFSHLVGGTGERRGSVTTGPVAPAPEMTIRPSASSPSLARSASRPGSRGTTGTTVVSGPSRSTTPTSGVSTTPPSGHAGLPSQYATYGGPSTVVPAPVQPYRDPRPAVLAYFTIACAAPTGSALTRFASSPDEFRVSQSWGWKSSSLQTEEYLAPEEVDANGLPPKEVSLRATIVVGVV